jgi:hypothetical protein
MSPLTPPNQADQTMIPKVCDQVGQITHSHHEIQHEIVQQDS